MTRLLFPVALLRPALVTFLAVFTLIAACHANGSNAWADEASSITVTDMLGRNVTVRGPAKRIVLAESRHILTLALIDKNPVSRVVAWGNDLKRFSPATFDALRKRFPKAEAMPEVGGLTGGSFSMEAVIAAKPDLVIFTLYGPVPEGIKKLDDAGIPYVFVDFFQKPLEKTVPSMRMLGKLLGREQEAEAFVSYYERHMADVAARIGKAARPEVFFHLNPDGKDCCFSSGPGNMSDFIAAAGGHNIGADKIPGSIGKLNLEYVLSRDPDFYLVGGGSTVALNGLKIGPSVPGDEAESTMTKLMAAPGIASLRSVRERRAGGIWLFFFDNPLFFVGVEEMAKMLHPTAFADVDPDRTLAELNDRFLAFPLEGTFWVGGGPNAR
jgi:iron complex transport system substrate-binding protein